MVPAVSGTADRLNARRRQSTAPHGEESDTDGGRLVVVGGGYRGRLLARAVAAIASVHHVDARKPAVDAPEGYTAEHVPDVESATGLAAVGFRPDDVALVATPSDSRNLLVTQQLRTKFDVDRILVVLNDPRNRPAFELSGVHCLCLAGVLGETLTKELTGYRGRDSADTGERTNPSTKR